MLVDRTLLAAILLLIALPSAAAPWPRSLVDGVVFFAIMAVLLVYALVSRLLDAGKTFTPEVAKARTQRRLMIVVGGLMGACAYITYRSMVNP